MVGKAKNQPRTRSGWLLLGDQRLRHVEDCFSGLHSMQWLALPASAHALFLFPAADFVGPGSGEGGYNPQQSTPPTSYCTL